MDPPCELAHVHFHPIYTHVQITYTENKLHSSHRDIVEATKKSHCTNENLPVRILPKRACAREKESAEESPAAARATHFFRNSRSSPTFSKTAPAAAASACNKSRSALGGKRCRYTLPLPPPLSLSLSLLTFSLTTGIWFRFRTIFSLAVLDVRARCDVGHIFCGRYVNLCEL